LSENIKNLHYFLENPAYLIINLYRQSRINFYLTMLSIKTMHKLFFSFSILSLGMIQPVLAQEQVLKTITVTGTGIERINATIANVQLGVEIEGQTATQVQEEVARRTNSLLSLLRDRNVERLQTTGISLRPNYTYNENRRQLIGYVATNIVSFELPIEQVGNLLDESVKLGATRIDNIALSATETAISQAQQQALVKASLDAQRQANVILNALNLTAQEIITIQVNGADTPSPLIMEAMRSDTIASSSPSTPIVAGEQSISASVTLQIRY